MSKVVVLGIESTAHTFGCGIVDGNGIILANVNDAYVPTKGGIHPRESAQHHSDVAPRVVKNALSNAKLSIEQVDAIAVSLGPGLGPCLRVGATIARALAVAFNKPLVPVNHAVAHIEIAKLTTGFNDPLIVFVSGGNTIVSAYSDGRYRVFGETLDIALGNMLDTFAREAGLPHPGGPQVEELARRGGKLLKLPYIVKGQDVSYSGLLTATIKLLREGHSVEDLCYSLQEYAFDMLAEVTERALAYTEKRELVLTGGVAGNSELQRKLRIVAEEHKARFGVVPKNLAGDNGAMIAWTGVLAYTHGVTMKVDESYVKPRWRLDEVDIPWIRREVN
ncbi:MAG: KEOPS complex N(6)-L-threonylcarbamoyladenine synthase Kae1 [Candidatus Nezhaarchaeota archaeon]|nr:KEOPS complex N(6)-L-threonylcarbamoyladenine synthase Kae1 [Candidatus Nezhaarchaeota archaeon]MCX8141807.1 KEOPS complex N(6)-L-threonylcarbamoyladenine synthase Kae1 [Candidatus Nezhaarchaeota archaeon]MDW8050412.1 KEOPS complex N(6)-L-threonylcarbamoyladenine synthase Kae1 [Nitrososphaerota archaeon]